MSELRKATLIELGPGERPTHTSEFAVQFNPTTLRVQMSSANDGGLSQNRPAETYLGTNAATLSVDLIFDTADEGTTATAVDVRKKTAQVTRFMLPKRVERGKSLPPRVAFHWGTFLFVGVMQSATEDLDLFSSDGTPLRAKVSISIREQRVEFQAKSIGPGANTGADAQPATGGGAGPGTRGAGTGDRAVTALGGEAAAELAARVGLDPAAWRGLSLGAGVSLSLDAGLEVEFSSGLIAGAGVGAATGVEAGVAPSLEASFGLEPDPSAQARGGQGFALAAAGGVRAASESVAIVRTESAAGAARAAFGAAEPTPRGSPPRPGAPEQARPRLPRALDPVRAAAREASPAPSPPAADPRATSFGFGVPLRRRVTGAADERSGAARGRLVVLTRERDPGAAPVTRDPTRPPWTQLPVVYSPRAAVEAGHEHGCACGCGGRP